MRVTHKGALNLKRELLQLLRTLNYFDKRDTSDAVTLQQQQKKATSI